MERLKEFDKITLPDSRNNHYVLTNCKTGEQRKYGLEDHYNQIKSIELRDSVPEDIRSQFNIARNISLYSWFCYPFHNIADMKSFSTLEMALRVRLGKKDNFHNMIEMAVKQGLIKDKHFRHRKEYGTNSESTTYVEQLPDIISRFRNDYAHGSNTLDDLSIINLCVCADFINQLFNKTEDITNQV
ncbi:MAG: hypothetical protein ABSH16_04535 [Sedimentisphaerales bacterium]